MKIGYCNNCGDIYRESLMRDDKVVEITGPKVLGHEQPGVLSTNYEEIYLILNDYSITRMSLCTKCLAFIDHAMIDRIFGIVRKYMIMQLRSINNIEQCRKWEASRWLSWHLTDDEARDSLKSMQGALAA